MRLRLGTGFCPSSKHVRGGIHLSYATLRSCASLLSCLANAFVRYEKMY